MLEDLANYRGNRYTPIVTEIAFITLTVFYNRNNSSLLELVRDKSMEQHTIEKLLEALKKRKWSVEEVFGVDRRIVTAFPLVHAVDGIDNVLKREAVI